MIVKQQKILKPLPILPWIKTYFSNSLQKIKNKNILGTKSLLKSTLYSNSDQFYTFIVVN